MSNQIAKVPELLSLDGLKVLKTVFHSDEKKMGILLAGENLDHSNSSKAIVRVYLIDLIDGHHEVVKELESFAFDKKEDAIEFSTKLSTFNAIDLILFLNQKNTSYAI